jgi:hypothetical protein
MKTVPYQLKSHDLKDLKKKLRRFRKVLSEAGPLARELYAYVATYSPLRDTEGDMMRAMAENLKDSIHSGHGMDAEVIVNRLIEIHKGKVEVVPRG